MYLAYKIINGALHVQSTPHGPWKVMSAEQITTRLAEVESNHSRALLDAHQRGRREGMEEAAKECERLLVFADTTSNADKVIPAAIRAKIDEVQP